MGCQGEQPKFPVSLELGRLEAALGSLFMNTSDAGVKLHVKLHGEAMSGRPGFITAVF